MGLFDVFGEARPPVPQLTVWDGSRFATRTWDDWRGGAAAAAGKLRTLGVEPGACVACILTNTPAVCDVVLGVWLAGGAVASMPAIARGMSPAAYFDQLRAIRAQVGAELVLVEARFAPLLEDADLGAQVVACEDAFGAPLSELSPPADDDVAFVQYSSGSTSMPKGCVLTAGAIGRQLSALVDALALDPAVDRGVTWLPLSHDMGFFGGLVLSFRTGYPLVVGSPERFLLSPPTWIQDCLRFGATLTATPNFALDLLARSIRHRRLSRLALDKIVIGADRVDAETLERTIAVLGPAGIARSALTPAYGLAECALAVTMAPIDEPPSVLRVSRDALVAGRLALADDATEPETLALVSAGRPIGSTRVGILGEDDIGEIHVQSPSLASGYLGQPELTRERFVDGGVRTGDLGFVHDGELYVIGRADDMLSVRGRNVYARDIERALSATVDGIRPGTCVLLDVRRDGRVHLLVLAEPWRGAAARGDGIASARLARQIAEVALRQTGVRIDECAFVARGSIPKTASGKIQRFRCRELLEDADGRILARVRL